MYTSLRDRERKEIIIVHRQEAMCACVLSARERKEIIIVHRQEAMCA